MRDALNATLLSFECIDKLLLNEDFADIAESRSCDRLHSRISSAVIDSQVKSNESISLRSANVLSRHLPY